VSDVDTLFAPETRSALLEEVRSRLPAFLSPAATEQYDPAGDVRELLGLDDTDLRRVVAVHRCLSDPIRAFLAALPEGLPRPITSSERPPVAGQAVRGGIDWGATIRTRAVAAGDRTLFVTRPARRIFDVPENRALAWLIRSLDGYLRAISENEKPRHAGLSRHAPKRTRTSIRLSRTRPSTWDD
jgi:hypothetical protein